MEFKDVVKKIMDSEELKFKLKNLDSFDDVYDFFLVNGYEGSKNELKEKFFKKSESFRSLTDDDLIDVAGGIDGRQVLAACAGLLMLTGAMPFTDLRGNAVGSITYSQSVVKDTSIKELQNAVENKDFRKVKYLVQNGANLNVKGEAGLSMLHWAVLNPECRVISASKGAVHGLRPQTTQYSDSILKLVKYMVDHGLDVNARDDFDRTPLHFAHDIEVVKYLVEHGADLSVRDDVGRTPVQHCSDLKVVKYMVEHGANVSTKDNSGVTMLHSVCCDSEHTSVALLEYLLGCGLDINAKTKSGNTPLHYADSVKVVKYLVNHGANINAKNSCGATPLLEAAKYMNLELVKCLVELGADVNVKEKSEGFIPEIEGFTPLHYAALDMELVKYLVEHGADINAKNSAGKTPLKLVLEHKLIFKKHGIRKNLEPVIEYLRSQGAHE